MSGVDQRPFRALFTEEAHVRLSRLGELVLELEASKGGEEITRSIFREVHTLKGSAAVVGFDDVSKVAHGLEEAIQSVRSGAAQVTSELVDNLLLGLDRLSAMIGTGEPAPPLAAPAAAALAPAAPTAGRAPAAEPRPAPMPATLAPVSPPPVAVPAESSGGSVMVPIERMDELVRLVGESATAHLRLGRALAERFGVEPASIPEVSQLARVLTELQERTMQARMVPVATITDQLHRGLRDLARSLGKSVAWEVRGTDTELDRGVLQQLSESLLHLVRNAVDHGIETPDERQATGKPREAKIRLHAMQLGSEVIIAVSDDGRGIDIGRVRTQAARQGVDVGELTDEEALQLVFRSGLSTATFVSDVSGRGVGLDVVKAGVEAVRGRVEVRTVAGAGTEFRLIVPVTLAVAPCLVVEAGGQRFALPLHSVVLARAVDAGSTVHAEGRPAVWVDGKPVSISSLAGTLGLPPGTDTAGYLVVVAGTTRRHAFQVDALVGQHDVVVKGLGRLVPRIDVVSAASVEPDGGILLVLDAPGLIERGRRMRPVASPAAGADGHDPAGHALPTGSVLVVDDAMTIRELQRDILQRAGYDVRVARDGAEALALLMNEPSDIVLTDVEMPGMDGFALTEAIRARPALTNLPVLILTSRSSDADRQRGLECGADGYIVKSAFDERSLLGAIERLLGSRA